MLPPLGLEAGFKAKGASLRGRAVLDMCASPGGKSGILSQLVGPHGFVLANEPNNERYATLKQNLFRTHCRNTAVSRYDGERLPLDDATWSAILLDPPCSGWGTVEKNPCVMKLWRGDKIEPLVTLQRKLLTKAARLLAPGGLLLYSTCTTNTQENEEQIRWATRELGLTLQPLAPFPGFVFSPTETPEDQGCLRVDAASSQAQGFFLACLAKPGALPPPDAAPLDQSPDRIPTPVYDLDPTDVNPGRDLHCAHLLDWSSWATGALRVFNDALTFLPALGLEKLPATFRWQGYVLGKTTGNAFRLHCRVRGLIPPLDPARAVRLPTTTPEAAQPITALRLGATHVALSTPDARLIESLLTGRSLQLETVKTPATPDRLGLFFETLPLCWLRVKGGRLIWSER